MTEHPLQLLVHGGGIQRRRPQHVHKFFHLKTGRFDQTQGEGIPMGKAGDELVERQLAGGTTAGRPHPHRLLRQEAQQWQLVVE